MAYSGRYKVINPDKYKGDHTNVVYRSKWELYCFQWCDNTADIVEWSSEEVIIPYYYDVDKKYHRYFMDLKIKFKNGKILLVEIKPEKETQVPKRPDKSKRYITESLTYIKNQCKWKAAETFAKDRGWAFEVWTEKNLTAMGIMPAYTDKTMKPLKPIKPMRKPKKNKILKR